MCRESCDDQGLDRLHSCNIRAVWAVPGISGGASSSNIRPAICIYASILMKLRNPKIDLVQPAVSVVLKAGHASIHVQL